MAEVRRRADGYWDTYAAERDDATLAAWFVPRCWREIDYVYMLGEQIRRYGVRFERRHVTALARQLLDVGAAPKPKPKPKPEPEDIASDPATPLKSCPCCGAAMRIIEVFKAGESPRHRPTAMPAIRIDTS